MDSVYSSVGFSHWEVVVFAVSPDLLMKLLTTEIKNLIPHIVCISCYFHTNFNQQSVNVFLSF